MTDDVLYDTEGLAAYLGKSPRTIEGWRAKKEGPDYIRLPKGIRYRHGDVRAWLDTQVVKASA